MYSYGSAFEVDHRALSCIRNVVIIPNTFWCEQLVERQTGYGDARYRRAHELLEANILRNAMLN